MILPAKHISSANGGKMNFCHDARLAHSPLKLVFIVLYTMTDNQNASVSDYYSNLGWNIDFQKNFNDWELESTCILLQQTKTISTSTAKEHSICWKGKKMWDLYSQIMLHPSAQSTKCNINLSLAKNFKTPCPLQSSDLHLVSMQKKLKNACLAQTNLQRRGMHSHYRTTLYEEQTEDSNRLFLHLKITAFYHLRPKLDNA